MKSVTPLVFFFFLLIGNITSSEESFSSLEGKKKKKVEALLVDRARAGEEELRLLREEAAQDPLYITSSGESLLHLACIWGNVEKVNALLAAGVDPNQRSTQLPTSLAMTPLTWCAYGGYAGAVSAILQDERTEPNLIVYQEDGEYLSALDIALKIEERGVETAAILREHGAKTVESILQSSNDQELDELLPPKESSPRQSHSDL